METTDIYVNSYFQAQQHLGLLCPRRFLLLCRLRRQLEQLLPLYHLQQLDLFLVVCCHLVHSIKKMYDIAIKHIERKH